jgi:hypothetical protein
MGMDKTKWSARIAQNPEKELIAGELVSYSRNKLLATVWIEKIFNI